MNKKVSIVMPMYGVEKYIGKAIESVLNQSYHNWELLIINDGSTDNSRFIAESYACKDERIIILDKTNGGLSDARNYGLRFATGDFVHFFDSDDYLDADFYDTFLSHFEKEDSDVIISGYTVDYFCSKAIRPAFNASIDLSNQDAIDLSEDIVCVYLNFAWNKIYRKSFLEENALEFEKGLSRIEDAEFFSRVITHLRSLCFIEYAGYHYVQRKEQTLSRYVDSTLFSHFVRSLGLNNAILENLHLSSSARRKAYGRFVVNSTRAYLNRLYLGFPAFGLSTYIRHTKQLVLYLHDQEVHSILQDRSKYARFLFPVVNKRFWFLIFIIYSFRSILRK